MGFALSGREEGIERKAETEREWIHDEASSLLPFLRGNPFVGNGYFGMACC